MKEYRFPRRALVIFTYVLTSAFFLEAQTPVSTVPVRMTVTADVVGEGKRTPVITRDDVTVKQGKDRMKVIDWVAACEDRAGLDLFILIDDAADSSLGTQLGDLRAFVNAQPATTAIAIGYMSNANVQIAQDFTADHSLAANAIRLPLGRLSTQDSPYLSLMSLLKRWPQQKIRREVIMVTDGIDRLRGTGAASNPFVGPQSMRNPIGGPTTGRNLYGPTPSATSMPTISIDADSASLMSQRYGVIVHGIYSPGVGRVGRNAWEAQLGQSGIGKIADETGGEYFALGTQNPVSFKPYFDRLQKVFDNQYYLVFDAIPQKKAGLQRVRISSEATRTEIAAADNVWVPLQTEATGKGN